MELVQYCTAEMPKGNRDGRCRLDERRSDKDVLKRDKTNASSDRTFISARNAPLQTKAPRPRSFLLSLG